MEIKSPAGEFAFEIESLEVENADLVLIGKMGVWEAKTHLTPADVLRLIGLMFSSIQFWKFCLQLPRHVLRARSSAKSDNNEGQS